MASETQREVYLDNNATTMVDPEVLKEMIPYFCQIYGNANSLHSFGQQARKALSDSLDRIYDCLGASEDDTVLVTSNSTEGNNTVLKSILCKELLKCGRKKVLISVVEHPSITNPCNFLTTKGINIIKIPVNRDGIVDMDQFEKLVDDDTLMVCSIWVNNETGLIMPIKGMCEIAHKHGALFHTDATQAIGKLKVNVRELNIDYLTLSGHKFHGPKGVGALYIKSGKQIIPLMHGGEQMGGLRSGTIDIPSVVGLSFALKKACEQINYENVRIKQLRDKLEREVTKFKEVTVIGQPQFRVFNTLYISFKSEKSDRLMLELNRHGIAVSAGSACKSECSYVSPMLTYLGINNGYKHSEIRFSLSRFTTKEEIDYTIKTFGKIVMGLRD